MIGAGMAAISPLWAKRMRDLGGGEPQDEQQPYQMGEGEEGVLRQLASQTQQPYRPGWAALPGVASSIVGGMAAAKLRQNEQSRLAADRQAWSGYAAGMGGGMAAPRTSGTAPQPAPAAQPAASASMPAAATGAPSPASAGAQPQPQQPQQPAAAPDQSTSDPRLARIQDEMTRLGPMLQNPGTRQFAMQRLRDLEAVRMRLEDPDNALDARLKRAQIAQIERKASGHDEQFERWRRQALAAGLKEGTPEFTRYTLTGQVSDKALAGEKKDEQSLNISRGLDNLARVPKEFSDWTLESAIGPLQGDDQGGIMTGIARAWGSTINALGSKSTTEVRNRIAGDTEALAAAIKPLIRGPGEGAWTDQDQARLVSVVGNLSTARDAQEYARALEGVRQRVMANFGIKLPPIGGAAPLQGAPAAGGSAPAASPLPSGEYIYDRASDQLRPRS